MFKILEARDFCEEKPLYQKVKSVELLPWATITSQISVQHIMLNGMFHDYRYWYTTHSLCVLDYVLSVRNPECESEADLKL